MTEDELKLRIEFLETALFMERQLNHGAQEMYDRWERALRLYASGKSTPSPAIAREALGVCEYWDAEIPNKKWLRVRRTWRRFKQWWFGPCC